MDNVYCPHCRALLFKLRGAVTDTLEIKCRRCRKMTVFKASEPKPMRETAPILEPRREQFSRHS